MEMSVAGLVTMSLQSYKHQTGTNVPDLSNSPGKLTDLLFSQQKGPAMQKSLIISYQGTNLPALHSDGTRGLWSPGGGAGASPSACPWLKFQHGERGWQMHQSDSRPFSHYSVSL